MDTSRLPKCTLCKQPLGAHTSISRNCPMVKKGKVSRHEFSASQRYTLVKPKKKIKVTNNARICTTCGATFGHHKMEGGNCPKVLGIGRVGWLETKFTAKKCDLVPKKFPIFDAHHPKPFPYLADEENDIVPSYFGGRDNPFELVKVFAAWEKMFPRLNWNRLTAIKYIPRAGEKDQSKEIQDLEKAREYLAIEIDRLKGEQ